MTISEGYCTRQDVAEHLNSPASNWSDAQGALVDMAVESASRLIDEFCNRQLGSFAGSSTTASVSYVYSAETINICYIDDVFGNVTVQVDQNGDGIFETTWPSTDFQLEPLNAPQRGRPYNAIRSLRSRYFPTWETASNWLTISGGLRSFYAPAAVLPFGYHKGQSLVQVTSTEWGWPAIPTAIKQATVIQASMIYMSKDAVAGLMGTPDMGQIKFPTGLHPQAVLLVKPYVKNAGGLVP